MNCREYTIEFEERGSLSETATLHLTICTDCQKLSEKQTQMWLMIDGLKRVDAPSDFDFRVKGRIAQAKPSDFQSPRLLPVLRYILPLGFVVMLLGWIVYFSGAQTAPQIAQKTIETLNISPVPPAADAANQLAVAPKVEDKIATAPPLIDEKSLTKTSETSAQSPKEQKVQVETAALSSNRLTKSPKLKIEKNSGGGNHVLSYEKSRILLPRDMNSNSLTTSAPNAERLKPANGEQILSFIGVETVLENGKRAVKSLTKNSAAERSGVKVGDVIEKIKDNSLTVLRGTEKIEINFQNNVNQPR